MTVDYLKKATTGLRAIAEFESPPSFGPAPAELPVSVRVLDAGDEVVFRAVIRMRVTPRT